MNVVLIGFMGVGKTRVGQVLAERLQWSHVDTDELVKSEAGMPVPDIIRIHGEKRFRAYEKDAVRQASKRQFTVISTGGGVPLDDENMQQLMKSGTVVWLKAGPETILRRVRDVSSRPLIDPSHPLDSIKTKLLEREPYYSRAHHHVPTDNNSIDDVVNSILNLISSDQP